MDIRNLWRQEPVAIAEAVRAILAALVLLGVIALDADQLAAVVLALSAVLGLLVRNTVTSPATAAAAAVDAAQATQDALDQYVTAQAAGMVGPSPARDTGGTDDQ